LKSTGDNTGLRKKFFNYLLLGMFFFSQQKLLFFRCIPQKVTMKGVGRKKNLAAYALI